MGRPEARTVLILIAATTLLRVLVSTRVPLIDDEAYYWLWSNRLDWSYLDHPPFIAYLIALTTIPGDGPLWLRLGPILCGAATTYVLFLLGRELFGSRAGLLAAVLFQVIPVLAGGGFLATPDAPLYLAWMLALRSGWHAINGQPRAWLATGAAVGVGMLSKLYAVFVAFGLVIVLFLRAKRQLRRWEVYAGGLIALVIFTPVMYWNATHHWAGVRFILFERPGGTPTGIAGIVELLAQQLAFALLLFFGLVWAVVIAWRRRADIKYAFLLWTSLPALLFPFLAAAATGAPHGNWVGPGYLGMIIVLGAAWNPVISGLTAVNTALLVYALLVPFVPFLPLAPGAADLIGWPDAARRVQVDLFRAGPGAVVIADRYQIAAQLGYYLRDTVPITMLPCPPPASIWARPDELRRANAVTAIDARWSFAVDWNRFFAAVEEGPPAQIVRRGEQVRSFRVLRLRALLPQKCPTW